MELARFIDHTILKPEVNYEQIKKLCEEALKYNFFSVCVNPIWVSDAHKLLKKSNTSVCTVVGFPLGANTLYIKEKETEKALEDGADEIDMVINIGMLKSGEEKYVKKEIKSLKKICGKKILKVIVETCLLTDLEKEKMINICIDAEADFIKTSTGFNIKGAEVADIELFKRIGKDKIKIKASGGIKDYNKAMEMIKAGADRIGSSNSVAIIEEAMNIK